jgi:hypothetical protein
MYFIKTDPANLKSALEAWSWLNLEGKNPIRVTAFADVFFEDSHGIWFLDTLNGELQRICATTSALDDLLKSAEGKEQYLFPGFVERAAEEGAVLAAGKCYDFKINPALGGAVDYGNVEKQDLVVALHIRGQIRQQIRDVRPGTKISSITVEGPTPKKPWWRFW